MPYLAIWGALVLVSRGQTFFLLYLDGFSPSKYKREKVWPRETTLVLAGPLFITRDEKHLIQQLF